MSLLTFVSRSRKIVSMDNGSKHGLHSRTEQAVRNVLRKSWAVREINVAGAKGAVWKARNPKKERIANLAVRLILNSSDSGVKRVEEVIRAINSLDPRAAPKVGKTTADKRAKFIVRFFKEAKLIAALRLGERGWEAGWKLPGWPMTLTPGRKMIHFRSGLAFDVWMAACDGTLWKLRQCRNCRFWYVARTNLQESCSSRCREDFPRKTSEGRAKRAAYMKEKRKKYKELREEQDRAHLALARLPERRIT